MNKLTIQSFWKKYGVWILIALAFSFLLFITDTDQYFTDFMAGAMDGYNSGCKDCNNKSSEEGHFLGFTVVTVGILIILLIVIWIIWGVAQLFYKFIFQKTLTKPTFAHIFLFVICLMITYSLFQEGFLWIINEAGYLKKNDVTPEEIRIYFSAALAHLFTIIVVSYSFIKNYLSQSKAQMALLQQKSQAEIQALKAQINPHFLFNTLNNLYGSAIIEDSPKTAEGIMQLSGIMRHAVESSKQDQVDVEKEIRFLYDYIDIQQVRIPKRPNVNLQFDIDWDENPAQIAPLLLMTFIENAFKYGISINDNCFINLKLRVENKQLIFECRNGILSKKTDIEHGTNTGIENTLKRLQLLYPNKHEVKINQTDAEFVVNLTIDLS
jgi:sensor histidine kinase YesM